MGISDMILLEFATLRDQVLNGGLGIGHEKETVGLGAFALQHDFGDHREDLHLPVTLSTQLSIVLHLWLCMCCICDCAFTVGLLDKRGTTRHLRPCNCNTPPFTAAD